MADIELVIKIPEETYKDIQSHDWKNGERWYGEEWRAIHNGTPLPKGHGNLIDENELIDEIVCEEIDGSYYDIIYAHSIYDAETIIEADKENK